MSAEGPPPVLSDGVLLLRAPRAEDADDITLGCQDPATAANTTVPSPYTRADADVWLSLRPTEAAWWASPTWSITVLPDDRWCGNIDLRLDGEGGGEVGYLLAPWARGHRYAARALRLVCGWGFAALGLQVVTWYAFVGNAASLATARSVGFQVPDAVFRAYGAQRGGRRDSWIGTLTPEDLARGAAPRTPRREPALTVRERAVLDRLALGESNRQIAQALGISENTVKNHVRSILEKLPARSRSEAVVLGVKWGLTRL